MRIRILLEQDRLKKMLPFCNDYIEVSSLNGIGFLCSETYEFYCQLILNTIDSDNSNFSVRVNKSILVKTLDATYMDLSIVNNTALNVEEVKIVFYNKKMEYLISYTIPKQSGVISIASFNKLIDNKNRYTKYNLNSVIDLSNTLSDLNLNLICLDGYAYGEIDDSYIFSKTEMPNFSAPAKVLKKIYSLNNNVYFIDNYIYASIDGFDIFVSKYRTPAICPIPSLVKKRYSFKLELGTLNLSKISSHLCVEDDASITMDLSKNEITIEEKMIKTMISFNVDKVTKSEKAPEDINKLLNNLNKHEIVKLDDLSNPNRLPSIRVPKWVLTKLFRLPKATMYISNTCVFMDIRGGKLCFVR